MTALVQDVSPKLRPWMIGVGGLFSVSLLAGIFRSIGLPVWLPALGSIALVVWSYFRPEQKFLGWKLVRLRKTLFVILAYALINLLIVFSAQETARLEVEARQIVALEQTDPTAHAQRMAQASDALLDAIDKASPGMKQRELDRRDLVTTEANVEKVAELVKDVEELDPSDREKQIEAWSEIVRLAPANDQYQTTLGELVTAQERIEQIRAHPEEGVEIVNFSGRKDGFGSVMILDITLKNLSDVPLKDFTIRCEHSGPSGTVIDSNTEQLFERLEPNQQRRFRDINMGFIRTQAAKTSCVIKGASLA